jgi:hypothetical protein
VDGAAGNRVGSTTYAYDAALRTTVIQHRDKDNVVLADYRYSYDLADRRDGRGQRAQMGKLGGLALWDADGYLVFVRCWSP